MVLWYAVRFYAPAIMQRPNSAVWLFFFFNQKRSPLTLLSDGVGLKWSLCRHTLATWQWKVLLFLMSVVLVVVTDKAASVLTWLSFPQEGLSDGLQLSQLQANFLQVEGTTVLDLPHGEWVHVNERNAHQLSGKKMHQIKQS